jgi:hypothetical protein
MRLLKGVKKLLQKGKTLPEERVKKEEKMTKIDP